MKILAVVAHPDDECLGLGGTLAGHVKAGDEVTVVIATLAREESTSTVAEASSEALGGVSLRLLRLPYMNLDREPLTLNRLLEPIFEGVRPDVVYTHWPGDLNSDHRTVSQATLVASRPIRGVFPRRILAFETPSSTEWGMSGAFTPNVFVSISGTLRHKLKAVGCYEGELRPSPHPRNPKMIVARAEYWGQVSGLEQAEAFMLLREVQA